MQACPELVNVFIFTEGKVALYLTVFLLCKQFYVTEVSFEFQAIMYYSLSCLGGIIIACFVFGFFSLCYKI